MSIVNQDSISSHPMTIEKSFQVSSSVGIKIVQLRVFPFLNLQSIIAKLLKEIDIYWQAQVLYIIGAFELVDRLATLVPCPSSLINIKT